MSSLKTTLIGPAGVAADGQIALQEMTAPSWQAFARRAGMAHVDGRRHAITQTRS